ncbi:MAG: GNAT family N-acetyltransferase [Alkalibacterium sp.]
MKINTMTKEDIENIFNMIKQEGWIDYYNESGYENYIEALQSSITYVAYDGSRACGYVRCLEDHGFGVYVYDLLVRKECRGKCLGRRLMERIHTDYENQPLYVMSEVDDYYEKLGYIKEGSIFKLKKFIKEDHRGASLIEP